MDKSVPRITVWHHEAAPSDAKQSRDRFVCSYLTLMIDSFSCTLFVPTLELITIYLKIRCSFTSAILF